LLSLKLKNYLTPITEQQNHSGRIISGDFRIKKVGGYCGAKENVWVENLNGFPAW